MLFEKNAKYDQQVLTAGSFFLTRFSQQILVLKKK